MYKSSSMKRDRLGDSPPTMSKRSRGVRGYDNNNDSSEDSPPPLDNRARAQPGQRRREQSPRGGSGGGGGGGGSGSGRYDDYGASSRGGAGGGVGRGYKDSGRSSSGGGGGGGGTASSSSSYPYKVLCMSKLHPKATDEVVRETLYREFKRYGDISVKVVNEPDERVAYVYFRSAEDAREVKHSKQRICIYDMPVKVEAAYESTPSYSKSSSPPHHHHPHHQQPPPRQDYHQEKYSRRSPVYDSRGGRGDDRYDSSSRYNDRMPGMPPQPMHYRDYPPRRGDDYRMPPHQMPYGGGGRYPQQPPPPPPNVISAPTPPMHHPHHPRHHQNPPPMGGPPHMSQPPHPDMQQPHPGGMGPPPRYENKKDRFPNYLQHVAPEEDPLATRTLFAGNLEVNISDDELRRIFGRYGQVEDIDIKRPPPGTGNAYAFVRFVNLDMAAKAKGELSGQYIGKFQCKIGYGKMNPTTKIWVGGLGSWTTKESLEREFDRFGSIKKIEWAKGEPVAYITYETIDAAQAAVKDMRGYPLGGSDKKLRTDFADASAPPIGSHNNYPNKRDFQESSAGNEDYNYKYSGPNNGDKSSPLISSSPSNNNGVDLDSNHSPTSQDSSSMTLMSAKSTADIVKRGTLGWQGGLILKNSSFPCKLYMTDGDLDGIEGIMKDEEGKAQLRITQRLRLDPGKLDDVQKRIGTSPSHGIFLAIPFDAHPPSSDASVQSRPLRNLVSYLKQKDAAGVISLLNNKDPSLTGVLYAFPPCAFSWELLKRTTTIAAGFEDSSDHLVIVVIRGGSV